MNSWFQKNLGDAMLAYDQLGHIEEVLRSAYEGAENPDELAAFTRHESEGHLHCEVMVYFSPGFTEAAKQVDAEPCGRPAEQGLSVLVGSERAREALWQ